MYTIRCLKCLIRRISCEEEKSQHTYKTLRTSSVQDACYVCGSMLASFPPFLFLSLRSVYTEVLFHFCVLCSSAFMYHTECKLKNKNGGDLGMSLALCNLRTDNTWFWDALHQVSHAFHPCLAFFCCLCGTQLSTTCTDDLKLIQFLSLPFCFNLLNTQNAPELKEKLGLKACHKFSLCVIEGNSFGASSTFTSQYSPECCMTLKERKTILKQNAPVQ